MQRRVPDSQIEAIGWTKSSSWVWTIPTFPITSTVAGKLLLARRFFIANLFLGDFKLTQSNAILRYLGGKYNLYGNDLKDRAVIDMLIDHAHDFKIGFVMMCKGDFVSNANNIYFYMSIFEKNREIRTG